MTWKAPENAALLIVDVTYDFLPPDGALKVERGNEIIPVVNKLVSHFRNRVWTKEDHDPHHAFFASSHTGKKPLDTVETNFGTQYLWPEHCVKGGKGATFHADLKIAKEDMIIIKGTDPTIHAYSAVYMDDRKTIIRYPDGKTLPEKLKEQGITKIAVGGLAYDFCAGLTAYDLAKEGFEVYFIQDASHSINIPVGNGRTTIDIMDDMLREAGVKTIHSSEVHSHFKTPSVKVAPRGHANGPA